ncbi:MAG: DNA polymerase III subunit alpha [Patescibacteria group bacterium]
MAKPQFVHLHVHSHYSLLDGLGKVPQLIAKAKEHDMPALALTDHGVLYGAIEFFNEAKKAGIKPIIGQEAYIAPRGMGDKAAGVDTKPYHMVLLAKNLEGYKNLIKITSAAHLEGYYYKPRVDRDFLSRHAKGLIGTTACLASETSRMILEGRFEELEKTVKTYQEIFGKDSYYLELQHHPAIPEQQVVNQHLRDLAAKLKMPLIATNDVHYVNSADHVSHDQLVCIQTGRLVSDPKRMLYTGDFSLKTPSEMLEAFSNVPEALENTVKVASLVDLEIPLGENHLPQFPLPAGETEESLLKKWCEEGLKERYPAITPEIRERLNFELETVFRMGFPGYFLIVADFLRFARSKGIVVGPGRGSAAGSIIAYATGITNVDPLKYGLLFERFLDPSRISMPDIDMDFEDVRRGEVIDYVRQKYGDDHVAGIITFGTIMARAAVRDVGRVLGITYNRVDEIAKVIPPPIQGRHIPLERSVQEAPELKAVYDGDPEAKQLIDSAMKLEGTIRHASQHACAIVISKKPLDQYAPVQQAQGGDIHQITQYSMDPIEKIGLLKMDFLGLSNLTTIRQCCEIVEAVHGQTIDIYNLPLDDQKTFKLLARGETTGVFQLESSGMKRYIKELQPTRFEDIVAMVALYRPGPMQWIQSFINRKNGKEKIEYLHPLAKDSMTETYGIPVYQEQVMRLSKDMCGFTGSEADTLRKAIGKKIPKLMKEMKEKFITGAVKNGVAEKKASEIWDQLEDFAAYCFNKSHAVCYALIAYQTAYLKANFPDCFMAALMTSDLDNIDRLSIEISETEHMGYKVLPPDVNQSFSDFAVVKDEKAVRFGLGAVKNVGAGVAKAIVKERKSGGEYQNLEDFLRRNAVILNKKVLENLIKAGALDRFEQRSHMVAGLELITKWTAETTKTAAVNQMTMFEQADHEATIAKLVLPQVERDKKQELTWEKELLGLYLSDHPLKEYSELAAKVASPIAELQISDAGKSVRLAGAVLEVKKITTKSNQTMAFAQFEDLTGQTELVIFPNSFAENQKLWQGDAMLLVEGKINDKDGSLKIIVDRVWPLESVTPSMLPELSQNSGNNSWRRNGNGYSQPAPRPTVEKTFSVELPYRTTKTTIAQLKSILTAHPGATPVELRIIQNGDTKIMKTTLTVERSEELAEAVEKLLTGV